MASIQALRRRGLYEQYERGMSRENLVSITSAVAGMWLPIALGIAHYEVCDLLPLSAQDRLDLGAESVRAMQRTFLATVLKTASAGAGIGPWVGLSKFTAIYVRMFQGGGTSVTRVGPKDARAEVVGLPLARIGYFRAAYRGFIQAGCEFFAARAYVKELPPYCSPTTLGYQVSWV